MTRDEILNMPEGKDIDGLIAKHVTNSDWDYFFVPSNNVGDAFEVVGKMQGKNFWFRCSINSSLCFATFIDDMNNDYKASGSVNELPLAICRAALIAVTENK